MLPFFDKLEQFLADARDKGGFRPKPWPLFITGLVVFFIASVIATGSIGTALSISFFLSPIWLPVLVVAAAWRGWMTMRRSQFIAEQPTMLLEIKLPRTLVKTPLAMETVLSSLHVAKGESNWYQLYVQGKTRAYWSLEIVSIEGKVRFYIWTRAEYRRLIESAFYAQYPGVQLVEVPDYTRAITATTADYSVWGCDFKHSNPADPYPIKTYIDYGLDKVQEEPEQVDPLANLIEFLGSVGKGEYFWLQIIVRTAGSEKYKGKKNEGGKNWTWRDEALLEVEKIRKRAGTKSKYFDPTSGKMIETEGFPNPTKGQSEMIAAIERNVSKLAFDVGIRAIYVAEPARFNPIMITGMIALWRPFNSESYNGIKPTRWGLEFSDFPWELNNEKKKDMFRKHIVEAYRRRQFYHEPYAFDNYMTMSTEELATIFHIPSASVATPSLPRIQSATSEAPSNLPT